LTFSKPLWVSSAEMACEIEIDFGDGKMFKSADLGVEMEPLI
jgi:hypothetical protein